MLYLIKYLLALVILVAVSFWFKHCCKTMQYYDHVHHTKMANVCTVWLVLSIAIRLALTKRIFSFDKGTLVIQPLSELLLVTVFSVFKKDEDCFSCFNKCEEIERYSLF